MSDIKHNKLQHTFTLDIQGKEARVEYKYRDGKMYLMHAQVPYELRGQGVGKELVLKTFKQIKKEGYKAIAVCSYIKAVAERNIEWQNQIG